MSSSNATVAFIPGRNYPERPNRLSINVTLFATLNCRPEQFGYINYDHIRDFLKTFPSRPHTDLLETLLDEIVERCFADERPMRAGPAMKLDIFNETEAAGVEAYCTRAAWTSSRCCGRARYRSRISPRSGAGGAPRRRRIHGYRPRQPIARYGRSSSRKS